MAIAKGTGTTSGNAASGTSITLNIPTGTSAGDLLVAHITLRSPTDVNTFGAPSGWVMVKVTGAAGVSTSGVLWYKVATGSEPANYAFTWTLSANNAGCILRFTGVDNTTPEDVAATANDIGAATTTDAVGLSITTATNGAMLVMSVSSNSGSTTVTPDPNLTEEVDTGGTNQSMEFAYGLFATAGATGDLHATLSANKNWATILWAMRPSGGAAAPTILNRQRRIIVGPGF